MLYAYSHAEVFVMPSRVFGAVYPALLKEAVDHAERLAALLGRMDPRLARPAASTWLTGRPAELECLVRDLVTDWRHGHATEARAAHSIHAYLNGLHRGLAVNFGELAPSCCTHSLKATALPGSEAAITPPIQAIVRPALLSRTTWAEVDDVEIVDVTRG